ncbi:MAG TPA: deoxyribose-phosphate aldolase [Microbacteriaceae bacterium]|nr:deoxyribose-phosphate aldolase [Microbacteriaceae bacterium]
MSAAGFAEIADHTLLASDTTAAELEVFLSDAVDLGVKRVCVSPSLLPVKKRGLEIVTVIGFPSGAHHFEIKAAETARAVQDGADEIDMVINAALVHAGDWLGVEKDIAAVRAACPGKVLKVILETANLSDEEIVGSCLAAERAGADFVKTSTGFHPAGGATAHAVEIMAGVVGGKLGIKASGGVRTAAQVREFASLGATRFGVSGTAAIIDELNGKAQNAAPQNTAPQNAAPQSTAPQNPATKESGAAY